MHMVLGLMGLFMCTASSVFAAAIEDPLNAIGDVVDPCWFCLLSLRQLQLLIVGTPNRIVGTPNRTEADTQIRGCIEKPNRLVASPDSLATDQRVNGFDERGTVLAEESCRRQFRQRCLEDILNSSHCLSRKGKSINSKYRIAEVEISQADESLKRGASQSESDALLEVNDSQILNMNRLLCSTSSPEQRGPSLTPHQIWEFIEQIGVRGQPNFEEVVRRIGDMEQRDWEAFQKLALVGKQNAARREVSSSK
ncbi:hypothetical protein Ancab_028293 [Ancistrocladus abbreviatus]